MDKFFIRCEIEAAVLDLQTMLSELDRANVDMLVSRFDDARSHIDAAWQSLDE